MKELEFNSDQKAKVAYLNETTSETFQYLSLILIMPVLTLFQLALSPSKAELGSAQPPLVAGIFQHKLVFAEFDCLLLRSFIVYFADYFNSFKQDRRKLISC